MRCIKLLIGMLLLLFLWGCHLNQNVPAYTSGIESIPEVVDSEFTQSVLNKYRPENATDLPDFSGDITDIRISVVPREYVAQTTGVDEFDCLFDDLTSLQIYYGYYSDGKWYDIPSENYDLKGIFDPYQRKDGFDAAGKSHIVKIGPYLLICIYHRVDEEDEWNASCTITDTLGNEARQEFSQYQTPAHRSVGEHGYGYFKENRESVVLGGPVQFVATHEFGRYYYMILDYDLIRNGYELECVFTEGLTTYSYCLDDQEINELIANTKHTE